MTKVDFRDGEWGKIRGEEVVKLDREILKDISGVENSLGLRSVPYRYLVLVHPGLIDRDLIVSLAQPARVWADSLEMPALESWDKDARWGMGSWCLLC